MLARALGWTICQFAGPQPNGDRRGEQDQKLDTGHDPQKLTRQFQGSGFRLSGLAARVGRPRRIARLAGHRMAHCSNDNPVVRSPCGRAFFVSGPASRVLPRQMVTIGPGPSSWHVLTTRSQAVRKARTGEIRSVLNWRFPARSDKSRSRSMISNAPIGVTPTADSSTLCVNNLRGHYS